jgi:alpha-tubulin suppressor-like RCC1 family protein
MSGHIRAAATGGPENPVRALRGTATVLSLLAFAALAAGPALAGETTTALAVSSPTSVFSEPVTLTATVTATGASPSGDVRFQDAGKTIGTRTLIGGGPLTYAAVSAGDNHACALLDDGSVQCWGQNFSGQLGDGTDVDRSRPAAVIGLGGAVAEVVAGDFHSCALIVGGTVQCWGSNSSGRLGDGSNTDSLTPIAVTGLAGPAIALEAGKDHTCAIIQGGSVQCWGRNNAGQLGNGSTIDQPTPVQVSGLTGPVTALAGGQEHTCALIQGGAMQCWGENAFGRLGDNSTTDSTTPVSVIDLAGTVTAIAAGTFHSCALIQGGAMQCWGFNNFGQLGDGTKTLRTKPRSVTGLGGPVTAIAVGTVQTCAVINGGGAQCWGDNSVGQLGDGTKTERLVPTSVNGLGGAVTAMAPGGGFTCARISAGSVQCWGLNSRGELGDGTEDSSTAPVDVLDPTVSRTASLTIDDLTVGAHAFTASYGGDSDSDPSASDVLTHTVDKAKTRIRKIKLKPGKPKAGQKAKVTVNVESRSPATARPAGKLQVKLGRKNIGKFAVKNGKAKFRLPTLAAGKQKLKVKFQKSGNFKDSAGKKTVTVRN